MPSFVQLVTQVDDCACVWSHMLGREPCILFIRPVYDMFTKLCQYKKDPESKVEACNIDLDVIHQQQ